MPLICIYADNGQGIIAEAKGRLTGRELLDAQAGANAVDHREQPILYTFFDFNGVESVEISTSQIAASADLAVSTHQRGAKGRVVAIYAKDDLPFALARMWQYFVEQTGWETMVFRDKAQAIAWLRERVAARFGIEIALA